MLLNILGYLFRMVVMVSGVCSFEVDEGILGFLEFKVVMFFWRSLISLSFLELFRLIRGVRFLLIILN